MAKQVDCIRRDDNEIENDESSAPRYGTTGDTVDGHPVFYDRRSKGFVYSEKVFPRKPKKQTQLAEAA